MFFANIQMTSHLLSGNMDVYSIYTTHISCILTRSSWEHLRDRKGACSSITGHETISIVNRLHLVHLYSH